MEPRGVHHVSVNVRDVDAAVVFYTELLGGTLRDDRPDFSFGGAWIDLGPSQLHLIEGEVPESLGQHFAVRVDDLEEVVAELRSKGVELPDPIPVGRGHQSFVNDPDGNTIELHQAAPVL